MGASEKAAATWHPSSGPTLRCRLINHQWAVVLMWIERREDQAFRHRCTRCGTIREDVTHA